MDELIGKTLTSQMVTGAGRPGKWAVRGKSDGGCGCARLARSLSLFIILCGTKHIKTHTKG
jgi:hypothetical protein